MSRGSRAVGALAGQLKLKCMNTVGRGRVLGLYTEGTLAGQLKWAWANAVPGLSTQCPGRTAEAEGVHAGGPEIYVQKPR